MNIFALHADPIMAAEMHLDKHVVKMPLETAQMLCTINAPNAPYKPTHQDHPCTLWAGATSGNYEWLVRLGLALCDEYTHRYGKDHKCRVVIEGLREPPTSVPSGPLTAFAQAMPDECKQNDAVSAYHQYYRDHKAHIATWKHRARPDFMGVKEIP